MSSNTFVKYETRHCPTVRMSQAITTLAMRIGLDNHSRGALFMLRDYFEKNPELAESPQMTYFPIYDGHGSYAVATTAQLLAIMASLGSDRKSMEGLFPLGYPEIIMDQNIIDGKHLVFTLNKTTANPTYIIRFVDASKHLQKSLYRYMYILME